VKIPIAGNGVEKPLRAARKPLPAHPNASALSGRHGERGRYLVFRAIARKDPPRRRIARFLYCPRGPEDRLTVLDAGKDERAALLAHATGVGLSATGAFNRNRGHDLRSVG